MNWGQKKGHIDEEQQKELCVNPRTTTANTWKALAFD